MWGPGGLRRKQWDTVNTAQKKRYGGTLAGRLPSAFKSLLRANPARGGGRLAIQTLSFNSGRRTAVSEALFEPAALASARTVAASGGGQWRAPAGECRARITSFGGSALLAIEQTSCRSALGLAVVTWGDSQAAFAWGELHRASRDGERRFDAAALARELSGFSSLPRMGTFVWPPIADRLDREAMFLVESTFWILGLAVEAEHGTERK